MDEQSLIAMTGIFNTFINEMFNTDDSSSSSDSDEGNAEIYFELNKLKKRVLTEKQIQNRIPAYIEEVVPRYDNQQFQHHFRLTKEAFAFLERQASPKLAPFSPKGGRPHIEPRKQLLSVIWLLANPESYRSVGDRFNMGKSSLSHCFYRVIQLLKENASKYIRFPSGNRREVVKQGFRKFANIPNVISCIDGTYVKIKAPQENAECYVNRKCFHGITLQAAADHELKFTNCFTGYPSSTTDTRIFRNSDIYKLFLNNPLEYFPNGEFILGDKAYPVMEWCIPPFIERRRLQNFETFFNTQHAKTRQCIERTFALYFGRFRRLKDLDMNRVDWIPATIIACCVLHNICLMFKDDNANAYIEEGQLHQEELARVEYEAAVENEEAGLVKRSQLARDLFNNQCR